MATATTTEPATSRNQSPRRTTQPTNTFLSQSERSAAQRLRTTMAAVRLAFTWLGVRKTLAPEQRTTAARAFHADRALLSAMPSRAEMSASARSKGTPLTNGASSRPRFAMRRHASRYRRG